MTFVTRAPFSAFWSEAVLAGVSANRFSRPVPRMLLIAAGLIAGATLSFTLTGFKSEAGKPSAIPSDREAAPQRPRNQRPYVPRIRIGLLSSISDSGASAPSRGSAAAVAGWRLVATQTIFSASARSKS